MKKQTALWKMRGGRKIRLCDMSDGHLINTMRLLERSAFITQAFAEMGENPFGEDTEAYACFENGQTSILEDDDSDNPDISEIHPIYRLMILECLRRGITIPD
jgi:hypothetical protein